MRLGLSFDTSNFKLQCAIRNYGFSWTPGEEESGSAYPAEFLDTPYGDRYWVYSWLWFVIFIVKANK